MADEKQTTSDIDDWLDDLDDSDEFSGELDQDNIDALLDGDSESGDTGAADGGMEEGAVDLDQSNIDALLGGSDDSPAQEEAPGGDENSELDQSNIDLLLGADSDDTPQVEPEPAEEESGELEQDNIDQDNIDALLSGADEQVDAFGVDIDETKEEEGLDVDQDEIDQLFSGLDDDDDEVDEPFEDDDLDFADVLGEDDDGLLDLGEKTETGADATAAGSGDETVASVVGGFTDVGVARESEDEEKKGGILPFLPAAIDRTVASVIIACLVLLVGVSFFFFGSGGEDESVIIVVDGDQIDQTDTKAAKDKGKNYIPVVADSSYRMPEGGGEVAVLLTGQDEDGDPLTFEITSQPLHGRLSGDLPSLTYLPNKDFPGEDRFEYVVSDGKDTGNLASVIITGPDLLQVASKKETEKTEQEKKLFKSRKPVVLASNVTYKTESTEGVTIDWANIWRKANYSAFSSKIHIDIDSSGIKGSFIKIGPSTYRYQPDPFYDGKEVISYRFKRGGLSSRSGKLTMVVALGSPAPEIRFEKIARGYPVGATVQLDATPTRDEARETLSFIWEQVSGVPVLVEMINQEGSAISFSMPSSFYSGPEPGPVMRLTAVDETGKRDVRDIKVPMLSRRQAALWRGTGGGVAEDPPMEGRFMPWPYDD